MTMSAKPIFLIALPYQMVSELDNVQKGLEGKMPDYYILIYPHAKDEVEFQCFYEKDFNEVKYEEMKQLVIDKLSELKKIGTIKPSYESTDQQDSNTVPE